SFCYPSSSVFYTLSLHDALPICPRFLMKKIAHSLSLAVGLSLATLCGYAQEPIVPKRALTQGELPFLEYGLGSDRLGGAKMSYLDRKSTRLNSSHVKISYAVFCL